MWLDAIAGYVAARLAISMCSVHYIVTESDVGMRVDLHDSSYVGCDVDMCMYGGTGVCTGNEYYLHVGVVTCIDVAIDDYVVSVADIVVYVVVASDDAIAAAADV